MTVYLEDICRMTGFLWLKQKLENGGLCSVLGLPQVFSGSLDVSAFLELCSPTTAINTHVSFHLPLHL